MATKEKKPKYPELWFIYDGIGTYIGNIAKDATDNYSAQISKDERNIYFDELFTLVSPLGKKNIEQPNSVIIVDVGLDDSIKEFNNAGFIVTAVSDKDHEELLRELDKLQTVKGGESKKYPRKK